MIEAGELTEEDTVVEIGPGFGVLTFAVAPLVKRVIAFEIEQKLREYWEEKQRAYPNVEVVWGNVLKEMQNAECTMQHSSYKVLANLPYQITSHAIRTLLELEHKPERIVIMVQKEVADRICAPKGQMSLLAISVQYYGTPKIVVNVPKGNFWPAPKVDSAVMSITDIQDRPHAEHFFRVVRAGFANKRKQVWRNLAVGLGLPGELIKHALQCAVDNEKVRAEALSVEDWERLIQEFDVFRDDKDCAPLRVG